MSCSECNDRGVVLGDPIPGGRGPDKPCPTCEIKKLRAEIERLEEALVFYADPQTYFAIAFIPDRPCGEFEDDFEDCSAVNLGNKPGKRARAALNFWEELKKSWETSMEKEENDG